MVRLPSNGSLSKLISGGLIGATAGLGMAYVTALRERGVTVAEMQAYVRQSQMDQDKVILNEIPKYVTYAELQEYVKNYTPWAFDKQAIITRMSQQDEKIGELRGRLDNLTEKQIQK